MSNLLSNQDINGKEVENMKRNKKKGFTLIELIVVIAILGILAAVAVPRISGFTESAKTTSDVANQKTLYNATALAIADGKITIPTANDTIIAKVAGTPTNAVLWSTSGLQNYLDSWPTPKKGTDFVVTITKVTGAITVTQP